VTVSSVHTSDLSSFSEPDVVSEEEKGKEKDDGLELVSDQEDGMNLDFYISFMLAQTFI
jgi:hypothetical protein